MFGSQPKLATPNLSHATICLACVWFIATLVSCHTLVVPWPICHRLIFLPHFATLCGGHFAHHTFVAATLCLSLVVAKLVMNQTNPSYLMYESELQGPLHQGCN